MITMIEGEAIKPAPPGFQAWSGAPARYDWNPTAILARLNEAAVAIDANALSAIYAEAATFPLMVHPGKNGKVQSPNRRDVVLALLATATGLGGLRLSWALDLVPGSTSNAITRGRKLLAARDAAAGVGP